MMNKTPLCEVGWAGGFKAWQLNRIENYFPSLSEGGKNEQVEEHVPVETPGAVAFSPGLSQGAGKSWAVESWIYLGQKRSPRSGPFMGLM